jgi:hypothetical protein
MENKKRPVRSLPPSKPLTGPAAVATVRIEPAPAAGASFNGQFTATARTTSNGKATVPLWKVNGTTERFSVMVTIGSLSTVVTFDLSHGLRPIGLCLSPHA